MKLDIRPGDIFCTTDPRWIGPITNAVQAFWDPDGKSKYSHSGIIYDENGVTSEALWTIRKNHLRKYIGKPVIIGRHKDMTGNLFWQAYRQIQSQEGTWYPFHRLFLHMLPPLAKYIHFTGIPVCSEWASKLLVKSNLMEHWAGITPNYLADMMIMWDDWTVLYEDTLTLDMFN